VLDVGRPRAALGPRVHCRYRRRNSPLRAADFCGGFYGVPLHLGLRSTGRAVDVVFASGRRLGFVGAGGPGAVPPLGPLGGGTQDPEGYGVPPAAILGSGGGGAGR